MAEEEKVNLRLEIAHVLFMDMVGYSKLLIDEQREALHELNTLVRNTDAVREAEAAGNLIRLPTGDGMALVFTSSMEAPVECALQISQALRAQPSLPLRMGIHSGPVQHVQDVNGRENIAGAGINIAQRVMDCGDAGHILVSKRVADDLAGSRRWAPYLHELGDCEVKHGVVVSMVNLYADVVGNPLIPAKFGGTTTSRRKLVPAGGARPGAGRWLLGGGTLLIVAAAVAFLLWQRGGLSRRAIPAVASLAALPAPTPAPAPVEAPEKSVAVLPFDNFSEDKDSAFFAEGVQDEVLTDLAKVADLKVISRSSVIQYKDAKQRNLREIGRALGVSHVVEGSVQRAGNHIRVTAQLIDARTDTHQWAEHYDRDLQDVFTIQSEIAQNIAGQLQAAISPQAHAAMTEAPTHDLQAYELYLRALEKFRSAPSGDPQAWLDQMIGLLTEATQRDPEFARAYAFLAEIQAINYEGDPTPPHADLVRHAVETVARLRPGSADAHEAMGVYAFLIENDYARAHDELAQAVRLAPNNAKAISILAAADRFLGLWDDSITHYRKAAELDPEDETTPFDYISTLEGLHRYPEAMTALEHLVAAHPRDATLPTHLQLGKARILLGWKADARGALAALASLPASYDPSGWVTGRRLLLDHCARDFAAADRVLAACPLPEISRSPRALWEGYNAWYRGDKPAAEKSFLTARPLLAAKVSATPADADSLMSLATIDAALGRKPEALDEARRAAAIHPLNRDIWDGPGYAGELAVVLAWVDEREEAIRLVQTLCAHPNGPSYGYLKLHPDWDPLRGDPRFEAAVASLAPKP